MDVWIINWKVRIEPDRDNTEGHMCSLACHWPVSMFVLVQQPVFPQSSPRKPLRLLLKLLLLTKCSL